MLPRTNGMRTANPYRLTRKEAANKIRKKPIGRPVPSPNHIPGTCSRNRNPMLRQPVDWEVRLPESGGDNFGAGLRAGVRIVAAEWIRLTIRPYPLFVLVTFVRRHRDYGADRRASTNRIEHSRSSNDIRLIRSNRILIGKTDQRLSRYMKDHLRPKFAHRA